MKYTERGTKGDRTKQKIIAAAVHVLGTFGEHETSFQKIADASGVSQTLVVHYFGSRENIFPAVLKHLLDASLEDTEKEIARGASALDQLIRYFTISLNFLRESPQLGRLYVLFYYMSAYHEYFRKMNTQLKRDAVARISLILQKGVDNGEFAVQDLAGTAKTIHNSLTGLILNVLTENHEGMTDAKILKLFAGFCQRALSATRSRKTRRVGGRQRPE